MNGQPNSRVLSRSAWHTEAALPAAIIMGVLSAGATQKELREIFVTGTAQHLKWGLIGCGDITTKRVAPALRDLPNCEFISVSRSKTQGRQSFAGESEADSWYDDWRELVTDARVEAVYIATPVDLQEEMTRFFAESGKHILCEKPMALSVAECDRMIDTCRANGVKREITHLQAFLPRHQTYQRNSLLVNSGNP